MARSVAGNVDINIRANDNASATLNNVSKSVSRLPEQFAKSAGALRVLEGGLSGVSSEVAAATGKVSALGSMIATGGPFGLALAGLTLAVGAATKIWQVYKDEQEMVAAGQRAIAKVFEQAEERITKQKNEVKKLADEWRFFGVDARQKQIEMAEEELAANERGIDAQKQLTARRKEELAVVVQQQTMEFRRKENEELLAEIAIKKDAVAVDERILANSIRMRDERREELEIQRSFQIGEQQVKEDEEAAIERKRRLTEEIKKAKEAITDYEEARQKEMRGALANVKAHENNFKKADKDYTSSLQNLLKSQSEYRLDLDRKEQEYFVAQNEQARGTAATISSIGDAWAQVAVTAVESSEATGKAALMATLQTARIVIMAAAAEAAAKAFAAHQFMPFVGIAVGMAAAGTAFALVQALIGKIPTAEQGGIFRAPRAGGPGLMVGHDMERTLTSRQTSLFERMVTALERGRQGGGGGVVVNYSKRTVNPVQRSGEVTRDVRELARELERLARLGQYHPADV